jgi:histidine triad (HIT) family protein
MAFLDIKPVNRGHVLIVPKAHAENLLETPPHTLTDMILAVPGLAKAAMKAVGASGFNLIVNNGKDSGQLVEHVHMHIVPRFDGDGYKHWVGKHYENDAEATNVANAIRASLS